MEKARNRGLFCCLMPPNIILKVEGDSFTDMAQTVRYTARNVNRDFAVRKRVVDQQALRFLRYRPATPHYPIIWQSAKQRRAFFATDGFGKGIPTQRSGKLQELWAVNLATTDIGGSVSFDNAAPYSPYVQGDVMQKMHIASGYHNVDDAADLFLPKYVATLEDSFFAVGL